MDSQVRWPMLPPVCTGLDSGNRGASESSSGRRGGSRAQAEGGTEMRKVDGMETGKKWGGRDHG